MPEHEEPVDLSNATSAQSETGKSTKAINIDSEQREDPTRYGDWVSKGRCIDF